MIFNWIENSKKILKEGKLSDLDDWEARRKWTQECAALRHARHTLGWDEDRCRSFWESLPNGMASAFSYDPAELGRAWDGLWDASGRLGPLKPLARVPVTEGDVAYLDSLEAPLWVRRYWLSLLIWVRTERAMSGAAEYDGHVNAWLIRQAAPGKSVGNAERSIARWSRACGRPFPIAAVLSGKTMRAAYVLDGRFGGGPVAMEASVEDLPSAWALLEGKTFVCRSCGDRFDSDRFGGRALCARCRIRARAASNREAHRKYDEKKRRSKADSHQRKTLHSVVTQEK